MLFVLKTYIQNLGSWGGGLQSGKTSAPNDIYIYIYGYIYTGYNTKFHGEAPVPENVEYVFIAITSRSTLTQNGRWLVGWLVGLILWHIYLCRLFNTKSIFM